MNKPLSTAIMYGSKLRNKYLKLKTIESYETYKKQRNHCVSLLRKTKREFYENLNPNLIADNKSFWKQIKPFFLTRHLRTEILPCLKEIKLFLAL